MFKFLLKNVYSVEPDSFGFDISDRSYKFAQLKKTKNGIGLQSFGCGDIKEGIIKNGEVVDKDALVDVLKKSILNPVSGKVTTKHIAFSLPEEHSFIRVLKLPKLSEDETKEAIKWEIEQNIPMGIDDVYFDWQVINSSDKLSHQDILMAAVGKNIADPYIDAIEKAGFVNFAMEPESVSVARSVIKGLKTNSPVMIVDIGATITSFIIFSGNALKFSSSVSVAGNKMIEDISKEMNVGEKEAKRLFYEVGFDKKLDTDGKVTKALEKTFGELVSQIKNYISFYETHAEHDHIVKRKKVENIILSGGVANLYGITAYMSDKLKIQTKMANPWINILKEPLNEVPELSYKKSLGYTTVLGLALRSIQNNQ